MSKTVAPCGTCASYRRGCKCDDCRAANRDRVRKQAEAKGVKPVALAPCGSKAAKNRHRRNGETCPECAPVSQKIHPCGTWQSRRRHARNNETCTVCDASKTTHKAPLTPRELAPCGTPSAKRRHRNRGETCQTCTAPKPAPTPRNPRPLKPCGTEAALKRHYAHGEQPCDTCIEGARKQSRERGETLRRTKGIPQRATIEDLITEIRFLINAGEGEHRILQATGYTGRNNALRTRLAAAGQHQLSAQIFGWDLAA
jgi:hypothetical protein